MPPNGNKVAYANEARPENQSLVFSFLPSFSSLSFFSFLLCRCRPESLRAQPAVPWLCGTKRSICGAQRCGEEKQTPCPKHRKQAEGIFFRPSRCHRSVFCFVFLVFTQTAGRRCKTTPSKRRTIGNFIKKGKGKKLCRRSEYLALCLQPAR